jgi:hypothetical protein
MSRPPRGVSKRLLYVLAGAAAIAVPPLLLRAEPENWDSIRKTVEENMSPSERDRLDRNTREYLALSEAERQKYRDLHAALQVDIREHNEKLATTMQDYYAWLATNQAYDRETVTSITDPTQRVEEIRRIVQERVEATSRSRSRFSRWWLGDRLPELKPDQMQSLFTEIENRLGMTDAEEERLFDADDKPKEGVARHIAVIGIMRERQQTLRQFIDRHDAEELIAAAGITLPAAFDADSPEDRRVIIGRLIVGNLIREFELAVNRRPPSSAELEAVVAQWPKDAAEQQKLDQNLELEPSDFRHTLEEAYAKDAIALDIRIVMDAAADLAPRGGFGRGRGPQDGPRGGERDRRFGPAGERPNPDRRDGRPPFGPRNGDRPGGPERGEGRRPGDRPPGELPPPGPPPGDDRPPPRP